MSDKKYDDEGKGYMWREVKAEVKEKGNYTLNDKKFYGAIIKSYNKQGEPKYEMYQAIGLLHLNTEKRSERTPDMGGKVTIATGEEKIYKLGCWNRETSEGVPFTSLGFEEVQEEKEYSEKEIADKIGF